MFALDFIVLKKCDKFAHVHWACRNRLVELHTSGLPTQTYGAHI
jgi:hypothetical protein